MNKFQSIGSNKRRTHILSNHLNVNFKMRVIVLSNKKNDQQQGDNKSSLNKDIKDGISALDESISSIRSNKQELNINNDQSNILLFKEEIRWFRNYLKFLL